MKFWTLSTLPHTLERYSKRLFYLILLLIVLFGLLLPLLRFPRNLNVDEPFTAKLASYSWEQLLAALRVDSSGSAPLSYFAFKVWHDFWGGSEYALRSLSLLCFGLTIVVVGITGREISNSTGGLVAAFLLTVSSNTGIYYAANVRYYVFVLLISALSGYIFFHLIRKTNAGEPLAPLWYWLLGGLFAVGVMTHHLFVFFIGVCLLAALAANRLIFVRTLMAAVGAASVYLLVFGSQLASGIGVSSTSWMLPPTLLDLTQAILVWGEGKTLLIAGGVLLLMVIGAARHQLSLLRQNRLIVIVFLMVTIALLIPFIVSQVQPLFFAERIPIIYLPLYCVLVGAVLGTLNRWWITLPLAALLLIGTINSELRLAAAPDPYPTRAALEQLLVQADCGDRLVTGLAYATVEYYLNRLEARDCLILVPFPSEIGEHPGWMDFRQLNKRLPAFQAEAAALVEQLAAVHARVWLFVPEPTSLEAPINQTAQTALAAHYDLIADYDQLGNFFERIQLYQPRE